MNNHLGPFKVSTLPPKMHLKQINVIVTRTTVINKSEFPLSLLRIYFHPLLNVLCARLFTSLPCPSSISGDRLMWFKLKNRYEMLGEGFGMKLSQSWYIIILQNMIIANYIWKFKYKLQLLHHLVNYHYKVYY